MRHKIAGNTLNRKTAHRKATIRDIAKATLIQERICTTKAKAKEARKLVDRLITMGKKGTLADKRRAFAIICDHNVVSDLFNNVAKRFEKRNGGYTRIILANNRRGDNAQLAYLELVDKSRTIISKAKSSAAADKSKEVKASKAIEAKPQETAAAETAEVKDKKRDAIKDDSQGAISQDKGKDKKKIVGGIRKMFNRKSSGK
ncbi:MAG: 50S ribosomal protein L17 [Candidatus Omnitrophica bacterium]|nr:50S ribosomal protein L17 [Candidatus Omnitrophota bacterium]MCB9720715.1 50S ribosomal protein L17 [Candidatus Omnitrophota bacterium]